MSLAIEKLSFAYGRRQVLRELSFGAENGTLIALLGPNGIGKTTLFRCILGLLRKYSGRIVLDGDDVRGLSSRELAHRLAYIPQSHGQTFDYSVQDMVLMGTSHALSPFAAPREAELSAARGAMERMGIAHLAHKYFPRLSGGEQQLVLIARALAQGSRTLLMDEPTASLDFGNQELLLRQARALADEGYCIVLSTHSPQHALWYADRALALLDGGVAAYGPPREVLNEELIEKLYHLSVRFIPTDTAPLIAPARERNTP